MVAYTVQKSTTCKIALCIFKQIHVSWVHIRVSLYIFLLVELYCNKRIFESCNIRLLLVGQTSKCYLLTGLNLGDWTRSGIYLEVTVQTLVVHLYIISDFQSNLLSLLTYYFCYHTYYILLLLPYYFCYLIYVLSLFSNSSKYQWHCSLV